MGPKVPGARYPARFHMRWGVDYTTRAARRAACEREVALNRGFAPDVYLGLGEFSSPGGEGPEPLVVRRMPADRRLSRLAREGADLDDTLRSVARHLAAWHADAPRSPDVDEQGTRDALSSRWEASFEQVHALADSGSVPEGMTETEQLVRRYLAGRDRLFASRIEQRRVVDGHGDLLAEDSSASTTAPASWTAWSSTTGCATSTAWTTPRSSPWTWNSSAPRRPPPASSLSTASTPAIRLPRRCGTTTSLPCVRPCQGLPDPGQGAPGAQTASRRLVSTTLRHLRTSAVGLTVVGGLPGSGKSTLSGALADRLGVTLLSSDRVRKELAGIPTEQSAAAGYGEGLYTPEWTARTYAALLDRAAALLSAGESVVLDATWSDTAQREAAQRVAERTRGDLVALHCHVPDDVSAARLSARASGPSDADLDIATAMAAGEAAWPGAVAVDTSGMLDSAVARALAAVRPLGTGQAPVFRRPYMEPD